MENTLPENKLKKEKAARSTSLCLFSLWSIILLLLLLAACSTSERIGPSSAAIRKAEFEQALASRNLDILASYSSKEKGNPGALLDDADREKARRQYEALRQEILLEPAAQAALAPDLPLLAKLLTQPSAHHFTPSERAKIETTLAFYTAIQSPAAQYRTSVIDARINRISKAFIENAARDPNRNLAPLVAALTAGESDPFQRIKLIHDWIADTITYDVAMASRDTVTGQDLATVLSTRRAVCSGYAHLFQKMAELAGFEARTINGFARSLHSDFDFNQRNSHAWNRVRIGSLWYLVDTTFDAGVFQNQTGKNGTIGAYQKRYSTDYLFPAPIQLKFTHFPENSADQLSIQPIDREQFTNEALIQPGFFRYNLGILQPGKTAQEAHPIAFPEEQSGQFAYSANFLSFSYVQRVDNMFSIDIEAPENILVKGSLFDSKGNEIESSAFSSHVRATLWRIMFAIPKAGMYNAHIFAGVRNIAPASAVDIYSSSGSTANSLSPSGKLESVMQFVLEGSKAYMANPPFPKIYARYHTPAGELLVNPLSGTLKPGSIAHFAYRSSTLYVSLIYDENFVPLIRGADGVFRLDFKVPATKTIKLGISEDSIHFSIVLAWEVR